MNQPDGEFQSRMKQLDTLIQEIDSIPDPAMRAKTGEVINRLMEFHGAAVARLVERIADSGEAGKALVGNLADDELIGSLFLLYGLHPQDLPSRVSAALQSVAPSLAAQKASVELSGIDEAEAAVRLSLRLAGHACPSTQARIKASIESAIYERAPDVASVQIDLVPAAGPAEGFVPLTNLVASATRLHDLQGANS